MDAFEVECTEGRARAARFATPHGLVETPAFMAVGTLATVKALDPEDLRAMHAQMILANAYHLHLRPGDELVRDMGGLHRFMGWDGPILTDSGGFQVFSLATLRTVNEDGVEFRSHVDGSRHFFSPERVMQIERNLGADVIMQFDHVIPGQSDEAQARDAMERSVRWLGRCQGEFEREREGRGTRDEGRAGDAGRVARGGVTAFEGTPRHEAAGDLDQSASSLVPRPSSPNASPLPLPASRDQALFPILQGGIHPHLRREAAGMILDMGSWPGFGIGGLSVGEAKPDMYHILDVVDDALPRDRPRYLMGVGFPEDLVEGVRRGVDLFDCVAPTRMGRNGAAFTSDGRLNIKRAEFRADPGPIEDGCDCSACRRFSRAYVRHLFVSDEILGLRLLSLHNVHFLVTLMRRAREAIRAGTFDAWSRDWLARYHSRPATTE